MAQFLIQWVAPLFYTVVELSLAGVAIGLVVLLLRKVADKKISPVWKNLLWILVLIALVVPFRPTNNVAMIPSVEVDFAAQREAVVDQIGPIDTQSKVWTEAERQEVEFMTAQESALQEKSQIFEMVLPSLWLLGMAVMGVLLCVGNFRIRRSVTTCGDHQPSFYMKSFVGANSVRPCTIDTVPGNETTYKFANARANDVRPYRDVQICYQDYLKSPALYGLFRPKILLPEYVEEMSEENQRYILLHELCHLKHHDLWKNALLLALQVVYWFNPLVWILFRFIRQDMELLNDERVLNNLEKSEQAPYAMSIIEVLGRANRLPLAPQMLCMVDNKKNTKRRIQMMQLGEVFKKYRILIAVVCLVIIGVLSALFLTAQPKSDDKSPIEVEDLTVETPVTPEEQEHPVESEMEMVDIFVRVNEQKYVQVALGDLYSDTEESLNWESGEEDVLQKFNDLGAVDSCVTFINLQNQDWEIVDPIVQLLIRGLPNNTQVQYLKDYSSFDPQKGTGDLRLQAFKGLELYVWKNQNGVLEYNLLPGTDALKTESAIYCYGGFPSGTEDIYNIGKLLTAYQEDTTLFVYLMEGVEIQEFEEQAEILENYMPANSHMSINHHDGVFMEESIVFSQPHFYQNDSIGVDVVLDYADETKVIFHGYFGLFVYDKLQEKITVAVDLAQAVGTNAIQGDDPAFVSVDGNGETVMLWRNSLVENDVLRSYYIDTTTGTAEKRAYEPFQVSSPSIADYPFQGGTLGELTYEENGKVYQLFAGYAGMASDPLGTNDASIFWPLPSEYTQISSGFGTRIHPITGETTTQEGIDISAPEGTEVYAILDGVVMAAGYNSIKGNYCVLLHDNNVTSTYWHLQTITVEKEQTIEQGDIIGLVGATGRTPVPQLRFELRQDGIAINPVAT